MASQFAVSLALLSAFGVGPTAARGGELKLIETDDALRVTLRGKPVLNYVKTARPVPDGIESYYSRSGYLHPIYSPTGEEITGDYPPDHAHQHALFFAWTKCTFDGKEVDFWNQAKRQAGIEFRGVADIRRGEKQVSFSVKHAFTVGEGDDRVDALDEVWTVTVHRTPDDHFLFDIQSVQTCASDEPLILERYRYGGMAFRGQSEWLGDGGGGDGGESGGLRFLTSDGKDRRDGNHTRPDWVSLSGRLDGQDVSFTAFGSPDNFRAPQPVRLHPDKPYFCFAPMALGQFRIEPGREYVSRYRYLVTSDRVDADTATKFWRDYAGPADAAGSPAAGVAD
ncbi:PmoA family protein [Alienimonas chondri]|uniref:Methane oxygenase PmoA n=1 Tax=Alienimonas chondri TaxID=2681879 RepID=A0ABX1VAD9_9PLAN|nr:PmoA family protein [Alienimonas chondri]NNJ24723.1 hypothetical protein [Alienimonas chondri]